MKSVLHVALIAPSGYSNAGIMKGFFGNGIVAYHCFDYQLKTFEFGKEAMRKMLIKQAEELKPDMIFLQIQGSDILDTETFQRLSELSFTVNYTFDIRHKEQTEWLYALAPVLGLICFSNQRDVDECALRGYENAIVLQSSVDFEMYRPGDHSERTGAVFIGNNFEHTSLQFPLSIDRREMVEFLQKEFPDQFSVYGNNWKGSQLAMQKEEIKLYQSAQIAICQNNFEEESYTSDRIWRVMACGAFCLTKYFKGIENLFTRYEELDWWDTLDELKDKLTHYLTNPEQTALIASIGHRKVSANHSWSARIKDMMAVVNELKKTPDPNACMKMGAHVIDGVIPNPSHEQYNNKVCDCGKLKWIWSECGCQEKIWQLRAQENI